MNLTVLRFDLLDSTNIEAIAQAKRGADEGLCIVAREQTAGRGRQGRGWVSEKDAGLYFSIVLRPRLEARFLPLITLMSAVAVFDLLKDIGLAPDIKWPNDLLVNEKKIAGILAEMTETDRGRAVIAGIGINITPTSYPPEVAEIATSIENETGAQPDREEILLSLTRFYSEYYEVLQSPEGPETIRAEWARRSSYVSGKQVKVSMEGKIITGNTCGIEESGALIVETGTGLRETVHAGDIERLRAS